jgi:hypothetical protein
MSAREKVESIFRELVGPTAERLSATRYLADVNSRITQVLTKGDYDDLELLKKDEAGLHLIDWQADAAFIVALSLYPDRFTDEEIDDGIMSFLQHAPAHIISAARILKYPIPSENQNENKPNQ